MIGIEWGNVLVQMLGYCTIISCTFIVSDSFVRAVYALVQDDHIELEKQIENLTRTVGTLERLTNDLVRAEVLRTENAKGQQS